ncbi:MAG: phenylacetate--CoA ligase family protein [Theionarchaea archaeon]|nr:phenylacetate--CoA ligase family protein [Theionarchaea archaeon]MBU7001905.1 phenylacetate--CoA ligase family protein [Theionarchaea archaeon]MBU7022371.1 phenylacetate--CoA ligase family protein [Theionarchaea archaeon]MBU7035096.1 phenylacetate--CoA ligase family protein [Theionarchaea archaeon]MBU7040694.1 phenylacetate--CoA ligase family protein [Theionarchaea archaeon]
MFARQVYYVARVLRDQWKSTAELRDLQAKRIRKILRYAYENTELYHRKLREAHLTPADFETLDDITKFPTVTKSEIRNAFPHGVVSREYSVDQCYRAVTSGSTGEVLDLVYSPSAYEFQMAATYRNFAALGYNPWHKLGYVRYEPIHGGTPSYERLGIVRKLFIPVTLPADQQIAMVRQFNPHAITGYPSIMIEWAKRMEQEGTCIHPLFVRAEAEILTKSAKTYMESVFGCPLYEEYGSIEFVSLAFECAERNHHISADNVFLEFLKEGEPVAPGEEGEIYATSLVNEAMPFIRYSLNDRGVPLEDTCSCGRGLPLMKLVVGRDDDFLVLPSGKRISPRLVIPLFELASEIQEFQVIQKKKDLIQVDFVPCAHFTREWGMNIEEEFRAVLGEPVDIVLNECQELPRGRHNRPRPVRSLVGQQ